MSAEIVWWGGYWMKSMMLSLGDGKRIFEMAAMYVMVLQYFLWHHRIYFILFIFRCKYHVITPRDPVNYWAAQVASVNN